MTDDNDDSRREGPTFADLLDDAFEATERVVDDIRKGIEDADEDHPTEPADPIERMRRQVKRMEDWMKHESQRPIPNDPVSVRIEDELDTIREEQGKEPSGSADARRHHGEQWSGPPADVRFCSHCGTDLSASDTAWHQDELLDRYRASFKCPECGYRGEVIRHSVPDE